MIVVDLLFLGFLVCCCCVLCCYVVKLAKAKNNPTKKKSPKKVEVLLCILNMANCVCTCKSYCFFGGGESRFVCLGTKHYQNRLWGDFEN